MEHFDSCESSSTSRDEKVEVEPIELLEEYWFFNNFFHRKTAMVRCSSDITPSRSSSCQEMTSRSPGDKSSSSSMPELPCMLKDDCRNQQASSLREPKVDDPSNDIENPYHKQSSSLPKELEDDGSVHQKLVRAPSLPHSMGSEKVIGFEEGSHGSSKLMRQASLSPSSVLPPQQKRMNRTRMETKVDIMDESGQSSRRNLRRSLSRKKTMSDLEIEELQGFKDLGFTFNKEDLNPSVVNIIPGLKERSKENSDEEKVRKPYLSEAWLVQRSAPLMMPNWVEKSSAGDMKEQLKFWAQVVASNARQEC